MEGAARVLDFALVGAGLELSLPFLRECFALALEDRDDLTAMDFLDDFFEAPIFFSEIYP